VNLKSTTLFVALIFCAAPALADRILPMDPQNGENVSHHTQQWIHGKASAIRFDSEDTKMAEVVVLEESHLNTDDAQVNLFTLGLNEGYAFGRNNDDAWRKHRGEGWDGGDGPVFSVVVPEPSYQLLPLFGLAGFGMVLYRRDSVKKTI
jgi:hypothetical protein